MDTWNLLDTCPDEDRHHWWCWGLGWERRRVTGWSVETVKVAFPYFPQWYGWMMLGDRSFQRFLHVSFSAWFTLEFWWQDGVDNTGMSKDKLYSTPEDVFKAGENPEVAFASPTSVTSRGFHPFSSLLCGFSRAFQVFPSNHLYVYLQKGRSPTVQRHHRCTTAMTVLLKQVQLKQRMYIYNIYDNITYIYMIIIIYIYIYMLYAIKAFSQYPLS